MAERLITKELMSGVFTPYDLLKRVEKTKEKLTINHEVPLKEIVLDDDVIVDKIHAAELADFILHGEFKQTLPFLLRARAVGSNGSKKVVYDIADAMHRVYGLKAVLGENNSFPISGSVMYGCSDKELAFHRALALNSIESVKFARTGAWLKKTWFHEPWSQRTDTKGERMTVRDAFAITVGDSERSRFSLTASETTKVKAWVHQSSSIFKLHVNSAYYILRIHEAAAPDLVLKVRGGGFAKGQLALTQGQLGKIALELPGEENYEIQRYIATQSTSLGLSTIQLNSLVDVIVDSNSKSLEEVIKIVNSKDWKRDKTVAENRATDRALSTLSQTVVLVDKLGITNSFKDVILRQLTSSQRLLDIATRPDFKKAQDLFEKWVTNLTNRYDLRKNAEAQDSFSQETGYLSTKTIEAIAVICIYKIGANDPGVREAIPEFLSRISLSKLGTDELDNIFTITSTALLQMKEGYFDQSTISNVVESTIETLNLFVDFKHRSRPTWAKMIESLEIVSAVCDTECRKSIASWIQDQKAE